MKSKRILQLDGLRIFMCLVVVCSHFEFLIDSAIGTFYTTYIKRGGFAVDFFFILSGFGIYYSCQNKEISNTIKSSILFAVNKIKKIYPIYIMSLCIGVLAWLPGSFFGEHDFSLIIRLVRVALSFVLCLPLFQSITGMTTFSHAINGVCWFLSSLFICYMFCPLFIKITKKQKGRKNIIGLFIVTLVLILVLSGIATQLDGKLLYGKIDDLHYGHPFIRCLYLLLGMCISKTTIDKSINDDRKINATFGFVLYVIYFIYRSRISTEMESLVMNVEIMRLLDILTTCLLIYSLSNGEGIIVRVLSYKAIVRCSEYCMYVFLFHYPIRIILGEIAKIFNFFSFGPISYVIIIVLIVGLTYFATIIAVKNKDKVNQLLEPIMNKVCNLLK